MLQADIGRVNARAGEERREVPQRDEKTLINVEGGIVEVTLRPSLSVSGAADQIHRSAARTSSIYHLPLRQTISQSCIGGYPLAVFTPAATADLKKKRLLLRQNPHLLNVCLRVELLPGGSTGHITNLPEDWPFTPRPVELS
jgi:hypothetical protein